MDGENWTIPTKIKGLSIACDYGNNVKGQNQKYDSENSKWNYYNKKIDKSQLRHFERSKNKF